MADTVSFVQGSTSLALNSGDYNTLAIDLSTPAPDILQHMPDYGENKVVRVEDKDRTAILQLRITGDDWDDVYNNLATLRRWLHEAERAEIDGDANPVYLSLLRDATSTASNATYHRIKVGWIEGDNSFTPFAQKSEQVNDVVMSLILAPYGELTSTISLFNMLASSPHFVEDSNADGTSDGWTAAGAATVLSRATNHWLVGGVCQRITTDATNEDQGMYSAAVVTCADNDPVVAYAWVAKQSGTDTVLTIALIDGGGTHADSVEFDPAAPAGYDKMIVAPPGSTLTWYRYTVSDDGTGPRAAADARLLIYRDNTDEDGEALLLVDACYLRTGTTTAPDAWASTANIENRNDPAIAESNINYIDVALIPGDAPAQMLYSDWITDAARDFYHVVALEQDAGDLAVDVPYIIDAASFTKTSGTGTWDETEGAGAALNNNNYGQYVEDAGENGCQLGYIFPSAAAAIIAGREFKVYVACSSDVDSTYLSLSVAAYDGTVQSRTAGIFAANNYELKYIGVFRPTPLLDSVAAFSTATLYLNVDGITNTKVFNLDCIFLMPVDMGLVVTKQLINHTAIHIDGPRNSSYTDFNASDYIGQPFDLLPGRVTNRLRVLNYDAATDDYNSADAFPIELTLTARTRHILGTI